MENKEILANKAQQIIDSTFNQSEKVSNSQIRNFVEASKKSTSYTELKIFLQYQKVRNSDMKLFIEETLKFLDSEYSKVKDFLARKEEIAYLFGLMARYTQVKDKVKEEEEKKVKDEEMKKGGRR